jgi:hypothetical protein
MGFVRQYQSGEHAADAARVLNELALARLCLLKPAKKSEYDAKLRKKLAVRTAPDPEDLFADVPLSEIPSGTTLEVSKRKRKSKKSKKLPTNLIGIGVAVAIGLVAISFIPRGANEHRADLATTVEQPAAPAVVAQPATVAQTNVSSLPSPQHQTAQPSLPPTTVSMSKSDTEMKPTSQQPMTSTEPNLKQRSTVGRSKSTSAMVDSSESTSVESELVGGTGGIASRIELKGKTLIGVDWQPGEWAGTFAMKEVIPLAAGSPPNPGFNRVVAPKGYAVGAIKVNAPKYVRSVQLVFMKIKDDGSLDPSDSKVSKWLGAKPMGEATTLSGEGKRLIGLQYRRALVVDAIGIIVEP